MQDGRSGEPFDVCVITARGGSKRIPRKNIRAFCGKPMITWSIEAALGSGLFRHVIVSTDDDAIAAVAQAAGAEVPFRRPAALADDFTGTGPVLHHAVDWIVAQLGQPQFVCCLYPTAPFVTAELLIEARRRLEESNASTLITAARFPSPIQRALRLDPDGRVRMFQPEYFHSRSQDLEPAFHDAGQFFWSRMDRMLAPPPPQPPATGFDPDAVMMVLPSHLVQDIDTEDDWLAAEWMFKAQRMRVDACS